MKNNYKFDNFVYESIRIQNQSNILDSILTLKAVKGIRQTLRHRLPHELPTHKDFEIDCDQLDDVSYIFFYIIYIQFLG